MKDLHKLQLDNEGKGLKANIRHAHLRFAEFRGEDSVGVDSTDIKTVMQWQTPHGEKRICYSIKHGNCVVHQLGCFVGTTEEAIEAIRQKYGSGSMYEQLLVLNTKALEV